MTTFTTGAGTLTRDALAVLQPGFTGTTAPDWVRRALAEGLVSVALFGRNVADPEQVTALTAQLRAERDDLLVAIDEEAGDVPASRRTGSSFPATTPSAPSTTPPSPGGWPANSAAGSPRAASTSTGRPRPTSTPTPTTR
ncbi:Beta-hexosaminidase [Streptomyces griseoloalbus]